MTNIKKNVLILCGGMSSEHKISLLSALNVFKAIDESKFNPILVGIDLDNNWRHTDSANLILNQDNPAKIHLNSESEIVTLESKRTNGKINNQPEFCLLNSTSGPIIDIDIVFPVMHGNKVEDGVLQGYLENLGIRYVGCGVLASSVCMDKDIFHRLMRELQIPTVDFVTILRANNFDSEIQKVMQYFNGDYPVFVKPANGGSSVGISKANNQAELEQAVKVAFRFDKKALVEKALKAREIEVAILGNDELIVSEPGEIVVNSDFYDYDTKYINTNLSFAQIPAKLEPAISKTIKAFAEQAYRSIGCKGLSRVDFFFDEANNQIYLNEINTLPGFTSISMYPGLMKHCGFNYKELITRLIELGLEDY